MGSAAPSHSGAETERELASLTFAPLRTQIADLKTMNEFGSMSSLAAAGSKPCMTFMGEGFEIQPVRILRTLLKDFSPR